MCIRDSHNVPHGFFIPTLEGHRMIQNVVHDLMKAQFDTLKHARLEHHLLAKRLHHPCHNLVFIIPCEAPNTVEKRSRQIIEVQTFRRKEASVVKISMLPNAFRREETATLFLDVVIDHTANWHAHPRECRRVRLCDPELEGRHAFPQTSLNRLNEVLPSAFSGYIKRDDFVGRSLHTISRHHGRFVGRFR